MRGRGPIWDGNYKWFFSIIFSLIIDTLTNNRKFVLLISVAKHGHLAQANNRSRPKIQYCVRSFVYCLKIVNFTV